MTKLSLDSLWAQLNELHGKLDEGEINAAVADLTARQLCNEFLDRCPECGKLEDSADEHLGCDCPCINCGAPCWSHADVYVKCDGSDCPAEFPPRQMSHDDRRFAIVEAFHKALVIVRDEGDQTDTTLAATNAAFEVARKLTGWDATEDEEWLAEINKATDEEILAFGLVRALGGGK